MALLVPLLKPNYTLYAANKPSSIYGLVQPCPSYYNNSSTPRNTSNHCYNLTNVQTKPTSNNNIILSNKVKQPYSLSAKSGQNNTNSSGKNAHKTPTTVVVNGNIIYSAGTCTAKYVLPSGLLLAPNLNSSGLNNGGARRFRSLSERSRVITPMPIIFENERLGSGPEMLFHPHTAPPVRKTRKSKSLPTSNPTGGQQESSKNAKDGLTFKKWFFNKPVSLAGLATTLAGKTANVTNTNSATPACACQACLCTCNLARRPSKRRKYQGSSDKQPKHRHRGTCDKGDPKPKPESAAEKSMLDVNNNHTHHEGKQPERLRLMEPGTATCTLDDDLTLLCPSGPQARKLSCGSNSNNSSSSCDSGAGTPSPSPPSRSPLNSEIALAGKFAFAQLYHSHAAKQHRKGHGQNTTNLGGNCSSNSKMIMLLRSLSGKLTLKHKDGTPLGQDLLDDPTLNDITITNSDSKIILQTESCNNPARPASLPGLGSSLNLLPTPTGTTINGSNSSPSSITFFKRFRTISR